MRASEYEIVVHFCTDHITDDGLQLPVANRWQGSKAIRMGVTCGVNGMRFYAKKGN